MKVTAVLHKGLLIECVVCNPTQKKDRREARKKIGPLTLDMVVRRQVAAEIGDDEIRADRRFGLLQKYGVVVPRIDRLVTKPSWMEERLWKQKQNEWMQATKGLATPRQVSRTYPRPTSNLSHKSSKRTSNQVPKHNKRGLNSPAKYQHPNRTTTSRPS